MATNIHDLLVPSVAPHATDKFKCIICSKTFRLQRYLNAHLKTHPSEKTHSTQDFKCTICSKTFRLQRYLNAHLKTHTSEKTHSTQDFKCTICSKTFRLQRYLNAHLKTHPSEQTRYTLDFKCTICSVPFRLQRYLNAHLKTHPSEKTHATQDFKCTICSKTFRLQGYLNAHLKTHPSEKTHATQDFKCTICSETFRLQIYLNEHLKTHSTEGHPHGRCFECVHCNRSFKQLHLLAIHLRIHRIQFSAAFQEHTAIPIEEHDIGLPTTLCTSLNALHWPSEMPKVDVDQDAKLIAAVEQNRCLYDPEDSDYKNDIMKENVWQKIAKSIDTTVEKAKARWQNLELLYQKSLNSVNKIHMFGKMSFLRPHLKLETREDLKPSEERSPISIKAECISSDDEEFADTVEATPSNMGAVGLIMVDPYRKSRVPLVTYENQHERSLPEDLDMKVEEEIEEEEEEVEEENSDMHEEPQNSTSCNSSLCRIPPSDTEAKLQEVSASIAKKRKYTKKLLKSEAPKPDQDLEYFKGFMSMIKELTAKRKRQLFASFAQELFRLLEEQEREESESTET